MKKQIQILDESKRGRKSFLTCMLQRRLMEQFYFLHSIKETDLKLDIFEGRKIGQGILPQLDPILRQFSTILSLDPLQT